MYTTWGTLTYERCTKVEYHWAPTHQGIRSRCLLATTKNWSSISAPAPTYASIETDLGGCGCLNAGAAVIVIAAVVVAAVASVDMLYSWSILSPISRSLNTTSLHVRCIWPSSLGASIDNDRCTHMFILVVYPLTGSW